MDLEYESTEPPQHASSNGDGTTPLPPGTEDADPELTSFRSLARRRSSAASSVSSVVGHGHMTEAEQDERRRRIKEIMRDTTMSQKEKSRSIQALMDGRAVVSVTKSHPLRRNSGSSYASSNASTDYACSMANAAALAADYYADDQTITEHDYEYGAAAAAAALPLDCTVTNAAAAQLGSLHLGRAPAYNRQGATGPVAAVAAANYHQSPNSHYTTSYRDEQSIASTVTSYEAEPHAATSTLPAGRSYRDYHGRSHSLQDWKDTDRWTAAAQTTVCNPVQISRLMEQSRPQCEHYDRKCTIISPCCGLAFGCRICHDDCPVLPPPLQNQRRLSATHAPQASLLAATTAPAAPATVAAASHKNKVERRRSMPVDLGVDDEDDHHLIDRFSIREVICRDCYTRQSSKTNNCVNCGVQFGEYHCNICNLWMSAKESPYHCADCGFCRVGGRENFTHCHDCGMCIDAFLVDDHNCKSGKYMNDCPICQEDLFSSRFASHEMPCGHAIHWHCFKELTSYDTRCPVCKKTAESPDQMAATWSTIAMGIALQPVPPEMARMVNIYCNDCESSDCNLRWHFLGVRCLQCFSFNTNVEQIVMQGRDAAVYLDRLEASYPFHSAGVAASAAGTGSLQAGIPSNISLPAVFAPSLPAHGMDLAADMDEDDDDPDSNGASEESDELMDH